MSSEFTPETERQRLQYLVRVLLIWRSTTVTGRMSELFWKSVLLLTWSGPTAVKRHMVLTPPHTPPGSHILAPCVTTYPPPGWFSPICDQRHSVSVCFNGLVRAEWNAALKNADTILLGSLLNSSRGASPDSHGEGHCPSAAVPAPLRTQIWSRAPWERCRCQEICFYVKNKFSTLITLPCNFERAKEGCLVFQKENFSITQRL